MSGIDKIYEMNTLKEFLKIIAFNDDHKISTLAINCLDETSGINWEESEENEILDYIEFRTSYADNGETFYELRDEYMAYLEKHGGQRSDTFPCKNPQGASR